MLRSNDTQFYLHGSVRYLPTGVQRTLTDKIRMTNKVEWPRTKK